MIFQTWFARISFLWKYIYKQFVLSHKASKKDEKLPKDLQDMFMKIEKDSII